MNGHLVYSDIEQGSDEWRALRAGRISASNFKLARARLKPKKGETRGEPSEKMLGYAATVAVERIARHPLDRGFASWQMKEGTLQGSSARVAYEVETGNLVDELGMVMTEDGVFSYSPDGLCGEDGLVEIKTLLSGATILDVLGRGDISEYLDQCIGGLWLTGRQWIDLVLWCPALEAIGRQLTIRRIERDEAAIEALETDLLDFMRLVDSYEALLRGTPQQAAKVLELAEAA